MLLINKPMSEEEIEGLEHNFYYSLLKNIKSTNVNSWNKLVEKEKDARYAALFNDEKNNLIEWINFERGKDVLVIEPQCGGIIDYLCKISKEVVCIGSNFIENKINYMLNSHHDNLKIYEGFIDELSFGKKYDYIISMCAIEKNKNLSKKWDELKFLNYLRRLLTEKGIFIAIEDNIYGFKYFDGLKTEIDPVFSTITSDKSNKKTYNQLKELFEKTDWFYKFYYPLPDYNLPTSIFSDKYLPQELEEFPNIWSENKSRLFSQAKAMQVAKKKGVSSFFSNSFIIIASANKLCIEEHPIYIKYSNDRDKSRNICTEVRLETSGKRYVKKRWINKFSRKHITNMHHYYLNNSMLYESLGIELSPCKLCNDGIEYEWIEGNTLENELIRLSTKNDKRNFFRIYDDFVEVLKVQASTYFIESEAFKEVFGSQALHKELLAIISQCNIDYTPQNVICTSTNKKYIIDYEWICNFPVPYLYIVHRGIRQLSLHGLDYNFVEQLYSRYNVDRELLELFLKMDTNFDKYVNGTHFTLRKIPEKRIVNNNSVQVFVKNEVAGKYSFTNIGDKYLIDLDNTLQIYLDIKQEWKVLRIDPVSEFCFVNVLSVSDENGRVINFTTNGEEIIKNMWVFKHKDPQIIINVTNIKKVNISMKVFSTY